MSDQFKYLSNAIRNKDEKNEEPKIEVFVTTPPGGNDRTVKQIADQMSRSLARASRRHN